MVLFALVTYTTTFAQQTQYAAWQHPIIGQLQNKSPNVVGFGIKNNDKWINIAILDKTTKELYWITYTGFVVDKVVVSETAYQNLNTKKLDPFEYHQTLWETGLELVDAAILKLRFPKISIKYPGIEDYEQNVQQVFQLPNIKSAKSSLEKLKALFEERQVHLFNLAQCKASHPDKISTDTAFVKLLSSKTKGTIKVFGNPDSAKLAVFYSPNIFSPIYKAVLDLTSSSLSFYTKDQVLYDSMKILSKNARRIIKEKIDVFALYQNYNAWRLAQVDSISKQLASYQTSQTITDGFIQALLTKNQGNSQLLWFSVLQNQKTYLTNLKVLNSISTHYYEQALKSEISKANRLTTGQYQESSGTIFLGTLVTVERGNKQYELTDHRGNVMAVITDKKKQVDNDNDGIVDYYEADVVKATDYSSFGAPLPGRTFEIQEYKYGYNGKENDKETGYQDYGFRMYDPNIGRFISVDPITKKFPDLTPYQFASNTPIQAIDLDGTEAVRVSRIQYAVYDRTKLKKTEWLEVASFYGIYPDWESFTKAARYNTIHGDPTSPKLYGEFFQKQNYYLWAQEEVNSKKINTVFFSMASTVVNDVGLSVYDPGVLSDKTKSLLGKIGDEVLSLNMGVTKELLNTGAFKGISGGMGLDKALLYNEQSALQRFLDKMSGSEKDDAIKDYNKGFKIMQRARGKNYYLNVAKDVIGGDIDFGNMSHRMTIGLVLSYQKRGIKIDDKVRADIKKMSDDYANQYKQEQEKKSTN